MSGKFAEDFFTIPVALKENESLREKILLLIQKEPMPGKILEGENRLETFRTILADLAYGKINLEQAYERAQTELPPHTSPHRSNNRVFAQGWAERQVRTQFSRFYNQAVLEQLRDQEATECYVPHSDAEDMTSACTRQLAGSRHSVDLLYQRLIDAYSKGNWSNEVKIPNHPHCTHTVKPIES